MGTSFQTVYDAFLARIQADDWDLPGQLQIAYRDWMQLLKIAVFRFRYPRIDLSFQQGQDEFVQEITNEQIQVLATYMKHQWIKRCIASWEEIKMLYSNRDFSQANHLDKLIKLNQQVTAQCALMQDTYSRAINKKPFDFRLFAGKKGINGTY